MPPIPKSKAKVAKPEPKKELSLLHKKVELQDDNVFNYNQYFQKKYHK